MTPISNTGGGRHQSERATEIIAHAAAEFVAREAGTESLITVIRAQHQSGLGAGRAGAKVIIFVSVYPVEKARAASAPSSS